VVVVYFILLSDYTAIFVGNMLLYGADSLVSGWCCDYNSWCIRSFLYPAFVWVL